MKKLLLFSFVFFAVIHLSAQNTNRVFYHDTSIVQQKISASGDTFYIVKSQFSKGDIDLFYDSGMKKKHSEMHFDNAGNKTGTWFEYYDNGKEKAEWIYTDAWFVAFPSGHSVYPDGKIKIERITKNDSLIETNYFPDGKISKVRKWIKGGMIISQTEWCENGQQLISFNPTSSKPVFIRKFDCNGNLKAEYSWNMFGYTGSYIEYSDNGKISVKGQYEDLPTEANALLARKTGDWIYYDENGKIIKTEHWNLGRLMGTDKP